MQAGPNDVYISDMRLDDYGGQEYKVVRTSALMAIRIYCSRNLSLSLGVQAIKPTMSGTIL